MIAMLSNQMFYRTVEEIGNDCNVKIGNDCNQMFYRTVEEFYRTVEEIGNDCNVKQSDVLQNC